MVFYDKEVSNEHLKVFGCEAFVHIPQDERSNLDSKTRQCILLSYGGDQFGYKLLDPIAIKVVRSRDVVFVENQTIEDIVKRKEKVPESIPVGVPPQRQQDRNDPDPGPADSAHQEAEEDDAKDVQEDAHSGAGVEDAP
jgi:ribosomal protein L12E/L44/L45/RPP1/RPP2